MDLDVRCCFRVRGADVAFLCADPSDMPRGRHSIKESIISSSIKFIVRNSTTGTQTQIAWVRTEYPSQLTYGGVAGEAEAHLGGQSRHLEQCKTIQKS